MIHADTVHTLKSIRHFSNKKGRGRVQLIKCLLGSHDYWSSSPQPPVLGKQEEEDPWGLLSLAISVGSMFHDGSYLTKLWWRVIEKDNWHQYLVSTCMDTHLHTNLSHKHMNTHMSYVHRHKSNEHGEWCKKSDTHVS